MVIIIVAYLKVNSLKQFTSITNFKFMYSEKEYFMLNRCEDICILNHIWCIVNAVVTFCDYLNQISVNFGGEI